MATRYNPRSEVQIEKHTMVASMEVRKWLQQQDSFLFRSDQKNDPRRARLRVSNIHEVEAQQYWDAFRKHRASWQDSKTPPELIGEHGRRTTYYALAATAIARARFVLTGVAMNHDFDTCENASWSVLDSYTTKLRHKEEALPQRRTFARASLAQYVEEYRAPGAYGKIDQTLIALAGCAIAAVSDQMTSEQEVPEMPQPGMLGLSFSGGSVWHGRKPSGL